EDRGVELDKDVLDALIDPLDHLLRNAVAHGEEAPEERRRLGKSASNVTAMSWMFSAAKSFNGDVSSWDVSGVTNMSAMFFGTSSFNGDVSRWDVSRVTDMGLMFRNATSFNGDVSRWDVSRVTDMGLMFAEASLFNGDVSSWDVSSVTNMHAMFLDATSFNGDVSSWDVSNVTSMGDMFRNATSFNGDVSGWDVSNVMSMWSMFSNATSFNGDVSGWDVSTATNMGGMFAGASSFDSDVSGWDVSNVTSFENPLYREGFLQGAALSITHYDALLIVWSQLPLQANLEFDAGASMYSPAAQQARDRLTNHFRWRITDAGSSAPSVPQIQAPADGVRLTLEDDPAQPVAIVWAPSTDAQGDAITYTWELALNEAISPDSIVTSLGPTQETTLQTTMGELAAAVDAAGVPLGQRTTLYHRVTARAGADSTYSAVVQLRLTRGTFVAAEDEAALPGELSLAGSYPNPFTSTTRIRYGLPTPGHVRLVVYDALGREVARLAEGAQRAGWHEVEWAPVVGRLPSGVYVYRVEHERRQVTRTMLLVK
ncbi:MAG: BspA family leucine-rich repeat surface protein, partial [Bacteroidota bacterium]